jgi:hypothetical protein
MPARAHRHQLFFEFCIHVLVWELIRAHELDEIVFVHPLGKVLVPMHILPIALRKRQLRKRQHHTLHLNREINHDRAHREIRNQHVGAERIAHGGEYAAEEISEVVEIFEHHDDADEF